MVLSARGWKLLWAGGDVVGPMSPIVSVTLAARALALRRHAGRPGWELHMMPAASKVVHLGRGLHRRERAGPWERGGCSHPSVRNLKSVWAPPEHAGQKKVLAVKQYIELNSVCPLGLLLMSRGTTLLMALSDTLADSFQNDRRNKLETKS